jgi:multiple sugar transport system substrate-binding protein
MTHHEQPAGAGRGPARLRGSSWDHPRGHAPMIATAAAYEQVTGGRVEVAWVPRSLKEFGMTSVESLARDFDLIVIDHPHIGVMAESGCVLPLDELIDAGDVADLAEQSPGRSHDSYRYDGHQWALAIDAACQASAWRGDLLTAPPASWAAVVALSKSGTVLWPLGEVDAAASMLSLAAGVGKPAPASPAEFIDRQTGRWALGLMRSVADRSDPCCLRMNPIDVFEAMCESDRFAYSPLAFCYVSYSAASRPGSRLRFGNVPGGRGALLGGAGLAVSALRSAPAEAVSYAAYVASGQTQRGLYFTSGGQPAHRAAWADAEVDAASGGFFSGLADAMRHSWTRPRGPAFAGFQNSMIELFAGWRERADDPDGLLDDLDRLYLTAMGAGASAD